MPKKDNNVSINLKSYKNKKLALKKSLIQKNSINLINKSLNTKIHIKISYLNIFFKIDYTKHVFMVLKGSLV